MLKLAPHRECADRMFRAAYLSVFLTGACSLAGCTTMTMGDLKTFATRGAPDMASFDVARRGVSGVYGDAFASPAMRPIHPQMQALIAQRPARSVDTPTPVSAHISREKGVASIVFDPLRAALPALKESVAQAKTIGPIIAADRKIADYLRQANSLSGMGSDEYAFFGQITQRLQQAGLPSGIASLSERNIRQPELMASR